MRSQNASGLGERADNEGTLTTGDKLDGEPSGWGPPGPDGGPAMSPMPPAAPAPPFSATHCPCLRGPCRYLHTVWTHFDHGNAAGTLATQPRERHTSCSAQLGVYLELSADSPVLECNRWDPKDVAEVNAVARRRAEYFAAHPELDPDKQAAELEDAINAAGDDDVDSN